MERCKRYINAPTKSRIKLDKGNGASHSLQAHLRQDSAFLDTQQRDMGKHRVYAHKLSGPFAWTQRPELPGLLAPWILATIEHRCEAEDHSMSVLLDNGRCSLSGPGINPWFLQ